VASFFTHAFTAAALAPMLAPRPGWRWTIAAGILASTLPDADVFGYYLGVPYRSFFGHRGVTHSHG
jgi:inner membrane protein